MIVVVGASGVGKDSLMTFAASRLKDRPDIEFVRRLITRPGDAGGEEHLAVSSAEFDRLAATGGFAVHWRAHGHGYGLPVGTVAAVAGGKCLVANGSRAALADFAATYAALDVIRITASRDCLMRRLLARGRETAAEIAARLDRPEPPLPPGLRVHAVDNSGDLDVAGRHFQTLIETISDRTA